jgi:hypothetical protein
VIVSAFAGNLYDRHGHRADRRSGVAVSRIYRAVRWCELRPYPLCVAHADDRPPAEQRVFARAILVLVCSAGTAAGPLAAVGIMTLSGAASLFLFIAAAAMLFGLWRRATVLPVPIEAPQTCQVPPRTPPMVAELEPIGAGEPWKFL